MATRTPSTKAKTSRTTTRKAATRKTPAAKAPAKRQASAKQAGAGQSATKRATKTQRGGAAATALAALRRNTLPIAGALVAGAATALTLFFTRRPNVLAAGHPAPDLEGDSHPGPQDRADPHFRPDMDAPMTAEDRAALAPALDRPTMVRGSETDTAAPATRH